MDDLSKVAGITGWKVGDRVRGSGWQDGRDARTGVIKAIPFNDRKDVARLTLDEGGEITVYIHTLEKAEESTTMQQFKIGDTVSGLARRNDESTRKTGPITETNDVFSRLDVPGYGSYTVYTDTMTAAPAAFKIGDRVSGTDSRDYEENRKVGVISSLDEGSRVYLKLDDGRSWWVYKASLRAETNDNDKATFKIGDRVIGWTQKGDVGTPRNRHEGVIEKLDIYNNKGDDQKIARIRRDTGYSVDVWQSSMQPITKEWKVGDYVSGTDQDDIERNRVVGTITHIDDDTFVRIKRIDNGASWAVFAKSLRVEPTTSAPFKIGDRISGYDTHSEDQVTGELVRMEYTDGSQKWWQIRREDNGQTWWIDPKTAKPEPKVEDKPEFKLGDRVSGTDSRDFESFRVIGTISKMHDDGDGMWLIKREDSGNDWWVFIESLRHEPKKEDEESETDGGMEAAAPAATADKPHDPALAVGEVDYNKPIETTDKEQARFVMRLNHDSYPFLVIVTDSNDDEVSDQFDEDGNSQNTSYALRNIKELPKFVYGRLIQDPSDGELRFEEETYDSEEEAAAASASYGWDFVTTFKVDLPQKGKVDLDESVSVGKSDDAPDADDNEEFPPQEEVMIAGRRYRVGDRVSFHKSGVGVRGGKVAKIRSHARSKILFQPDDGSTRYYALDKNIRA